MPLLREELIGARLYTGPMFQKYNNVLRKVGEIRQQKSGSASEYLSQTNIEEAIEEKEEAAAEISRKRKQEKRAAKIAACSADAEKSSVARGKRTKSRTDDK